MHIHIHGLKTWNICSMVRYHVSPLLRRSLFPPLSSYSLPFSDPPSFSFILSAPSPSLYFLVFLFSTYSFSYQSLTKSPPFRYLPSSSTPFLFFSLSPGCFFLFGFFYLTCYSSLCLLVILYIFVSFPGI